MTPSFKLFQGRDIANLIALKKTNLEKHISHDKKISQSKEEYIAELKKRFKIDIDIDWKKEDTYTTRTEEIPVAKGSVTLGAPFSKRERTIHQFAFKCRSSIQELEYFPETSIAVFESVFNIKRDSNSIIVEISSVPDNPEEIQKKLTDFKEEVCYMMGLYIKNIKEYNDDIEGLINKAINKSDIEFNVVLHKPEEVKKDNSAPSPTTLIKKPTTKKIFFSYSKHDKKHLESLIKHFATLRRSKRIQSWDDRSLLPGEEWNATIKAELEKADIIMLLISADAIATDYIWDIEIKRAMERHDAKEAIVVPIILNHCDWTDAPFSKLNALPIKGKPVFDFPNKAEAWNMITKGIKKILD